MTDYMQKFDSIEQLRNAVKYLRQYTKGGKFEFIGTVKIHGTNAGIRLTKDHRLVSMSRNNVLAIDSEMQGVDNNGFARYVMENSDFFRQALTRFKTKYGIEDVSVFGEWAGQGIQKGVAVSEVPKFFAPFSLQDSYGQELPVTGREVDFSYLLNHDIRVYPITVFTQYSVVIDSELPEPAQNFLVDLTIAVEDECPVGAYFGVKGVGEGVVWQGYAEGRLVRFKVKGEKHSVSKVRTLSPVDIEKVESAQRFVESFVTDARLQQGIDYLNEQGIAIEMKNFGHYIKWVNTDVNKEEGDVLIESGLTMKDVARLITQKAKAYFEKV